MRPQASSPCTSGSPPPSGSDLPALFSLTLLTCAALWVMWLMVPRPQRVMMTARLYQSSARVTSRLARRTAAASMANELATGLEQYDLPLWLAVRADRLERRARDLMADA